MKKLILLFVFYNLSFLQAANWDLFPYNQKSYFQSYSSNRGDFIDMCLNDTFYTHAGGSTYINMLKLLNQESGGCASSFNQYYSLGMIPQIFDSITISNDTTYYSARWDTTQMYFLPKANPGNQWSFNTYSTITITCDSAFLDTVLGVVDSIKIFSLFESVLTVPNPLSNFKIRLSKNYGLIQFVDLERFFSNVVGEWTLVGLDNGGQSLGFAQPVFHDYFPYHPGDILLWNRNFDGGWSFPSWDDYDRDSIIQVDVYPDSITYLVNGTSRSHNGQTINYSNAKRKYNKDYHGKQLDAPLSFPVIRLNSGHVMYGYEVSLIADTVQGGWQIQRKFDDGGYSLDTTTCFFGPTSFDWGYDISYNDHLGLVSECTYISSFPTCDFLIGARINGNIYGNIQLPVSIPDIEKNLTFKCYPSFTADEIYFDISSLKVKTIFIYNSSGIEVKRIDNYIPDSPVSMIELPAGMYFVKVYSNEKIYNSRFIKID